MHDASPDSGEFAKILTELQRRTGLSDQGVARVAGVNRSQVWRWIHSGSVPGYEPLRRFAAHVAAERPDLADLAAALLPAAGYGSPPATPEPDAGRREDDPAGVMVLVVDQDDPVERAIMEQDKDEAVKAREILAWRRLQGKAATPPDRRDTG